MTPQEIGRQRYLRKKAVADEARESRANARLIAAAPTLAAENQQLRTQRDALLAACKSLHADARNAATDLQNHVLADTTDRFGGKLRTSVADLVAHIHASCRDARAAIALATPPTDAHKETQL